MIAKIIFKNTWQQPNHLSSLIHNLSGEEMQFSLKLIWISYCT